jgi:SAM-dependent methyltransferase
LKVERAQSFGEIAEAYNRYRPEPPTEALDWLLPPGCREAVDLGAGTGGLSRALVGRVEKVLAVEPDPRMRAVLVAKAPGACVLAGRAEALTLADGAVDAVLMSSAWHWVNPEEAVPEIARILRPGGVLGLFWNGPDREVSWVAQLYRFVADAATGDAGLRRGHRPEDVALPGGAPFAPRELRTFRWSWRVAPSHVAGLMGTYSHVIVLPRELRDELLADVAERLRTDPPTAGKDILDLPMVCRCWRAVRL